MIRRAGRYLAEDFKTITNIKALGLKIQLLWALATNNDSTEVGQTQIQYSTARKEEDNH